MIEVGVRSIRRQQHARKMEGCGVKLKPSWLRDRDEGKVYIDFLLSDLRDSVEFGCLPPIDSMASSASGEIDKKLILQVQSWKNVGEVSMEKACTQSAIPSILMKLLSNRAGKTEMPATVGIVSCFWT